MRLPPPPLILQLAVLLLLAATSHAPAQDITGPQDKTVQLIARIAAFLNPPPQGSLRLGIVFDPRSQASRAQALALAQVLQTPQTIAGITLLPELVPLSALAGSDAGLLFLTDGLTASAPQLPALAASRHLLCVTGDLAATQAGLCAVAVQSTPRVRIIVNKAALAATGLSFSPDFMLMIEQI